MIAVRSLRLTAAIEAASAATMLREATVVSVRSTNPPTGFRLRCAGHGRNPCQRVERLADGLPR